MPQQIIVGDRDTCRCDPPPAANIPGTPGNDGAAGAGGAPGSNAWASLTADFTMPLQGNNGVAELDHTDWLTPGEPLFVEFLGTLLVVSIAGLNVTLENLQDGTGNYPANAAPGTVSPTTSRVTPTGFNGDTGVAPGGAFLVANNLLEGNVPLMRTHLGIGTSASLPSTAFFQVANNMSEGVAGAATIRSNLSLAKSGLATASGLEVSTTDKLIGRATAGPGAVEEIALTATGRTIISQASIAAVQALLGVGLVNIVAVNANYAVQATDYVILGTALGAQIFLALPQASTVPGKFYFFKKIDAGGFKVTVTAFGGDLIDGASSVDLSSQWQVFEIVCALVSGVYSWYIMKQP